MDNPQIEKRHVRKWGNGLGILLPRAIVKELGIEAGDELEFDIDNGQIIIFDPKKDKDRLRIPRYKLEDLLAGYDVSQEQDEIAKEWDNIEPVGQEIV
mgnify:FL=1